MELMTQELEAMFPALYSNESRDSRMSRSLLSSLILVVHGHGMQQSMILRRGSFLGL